jgi:hypothetical protein
MSLLPLLGPRPFGPFAPGAADRGRREGLGRNAPLRGCEKRMVPGMTRGRPRWGVAWPALRALSPLRSMLQARDRPASRQARSVSPAPLPRLHPSRVRLYLGGRSTGRWEPSL